jgi:hypothetical protein
VREQPACSPVAAIRLQLRSLFETAPVFNVTLDGSAIAGRSMRSVRLINRQARRAYDEELLNTDTGRRRSSCVRQLDPNHALLRTSFAGCGRAQAGIWRRQETAWALA